MVGTYGIPSLIYKRKKIGLEGILTNSKLIKNLILVLQQKPLRVISKFLKNNLFIKNTFLKHDSFGLNFVLKKSPN